MASNTWTQTAISEWGERTFGRSESIWSLVERASDEFKELEDLEGAGYAFNIGLNDAIAEEIADVVIVLSQVMTRIGKDLEEEIAKKMQINSMRSWIKTGDGIGRHQ